MKKYELILDIALKKDILLKATKIAFFVGIILNLINQGEHLFPLDTASISTSKLLFTFCVPFCVSMYTAISMKMKFKKDEIALVSAQLKCKNCNNTVFAIQNEKIPECPKCLNQTSWLFVK